MKVFICLDDKNGMLFNKRRLSKDRVVVAKVEEIIENEALYISKYTQSLFPDGIVCEGFGYPYGYAFIEDPAHLDERHIDTLYIFRWNRHYPSDAKFTMSLKNFELVDEETMVGYSHDEVTLQVYQKCPERTQEKERA